MKKWLPLIPVLLAIGIACSNSNKPPQPPREGVVLFRSYDDWAFFGDMSGETEENWKKLGVRPLLLQFVSGPGTYVTTDFKLITPEGEEIQPEYYKTTWGIGRWEPVATTHDINLLFNAVSINKIVGKFEIYLVFLAKGSPSPEYKLKIAGENRPDQVFPILPSAIIVEKTAAQ